MRAKETSFLTDLFLILSYHKNACLQIIWIDVMKKASTLAIIKAMNLSVSTLESNVKYSAKAPKVVLCSRGDKFISLQLFLSDETFRYLPFEFGKSLWTNICTLLSSFYELKYEMNDVWFLNEMCKCFLDVWRQLHRISILYPFRSLSRVP